MNYLLQAVATLIQVIFGIYLFMLMLRFLFQLIRADFYNPVSQAIVKVTAPPLKLLRRVIPGYRGIDIACIVLMLLVQLLELLILSLLVYGVVPYLPSLLILSIASLLQLCIYIYIGAILIGVIISWVNPGAYNPITVLIYQLTEPMLRIARRRLPDLGGLDFSPMVVTLVLFLVLSLVVAPLFDLGSSLGTMSQRLP